MYSVAKAQRCVTFIVITMYRKIQMLITVQGRQLVSSHVKILSQFVEKVSEHLQFLIVASVDRCPCYSHDWADLFKGTVSMK